jgi:hypothetical protein
MTKYVSLGSSCSTSVVLQSLGKKGPNYPFDWAFTNPEFILKIIQLCTSDISSHDLVTQHFFKHRYGHINGNFARLEEVGQGSYANIDYRVAFPHEDHKTYENVIQAYVRRIDRLKSAILYEQDVVYIWCPPGETPTFDGEPIIKTMEPLNEIAKIIHKYNPQAKMYVFTEFEKEFESYLIEPSRSYGEVAGKVRDIFQNIH